MGFWKSIGQAVWNNTPAVMLFKTLMGPGGSAQGQQQESPASEPASEPPVMAPQRSDRQRIQYSPNAPPERQTMLTSNNQNLMLGDNRTLLGG